MDPILVDIANDTYNIVFGPLSRLPFDMLDAGLRRGRCVLVTDDNVARLYLEDLVADLAKVGFEPLAISVPPGEPSKSSVELDRLYDFAIGNGISRRTPVVALGGGVVGDLTGYFAATVLRGVPLVHAPTTLVAQVDSAIGGKTGINHRRGKNLVGAFYQPKLVYSDVRCLLSLSDREWFAGLAEVVKHSLIDSESSIESLLDAWEPMAKRDPRTLAEWIPRSARVKVEIVSTDVFESGIRSHLNFGHTIGHAIENVAGYGRFLHGEAVAVGLAVALRLSEMKHPGTDFSSARRLVNLLPRRRLDDIDFASLREAMDVDKKNVGDVRRLVLLSQPGQAYLADDVGLGEIEEAWEWALGA